MENPSDADFVMLYICHVVLVGAFSKKKLWKGEFDILLELKPYIIHLLCRYIVIPGFLLNKIKCTESCYKNLKSSNSEQREVKIFTTDRWLVNICQCRRCVIIYLTIGRLYFFTPQTADVLQNDRTQVVLENWRLSSKLPL